ncbi:tRNA pseudouridine synthase D [Nitzschia inconspicua]|uniref:tRNA pseudouridine synthase D n=1 Tax=Nitzschia inconspicua TaxID=303405 RepID=A0A9K3LQ75_9STRA|nr:tRNA pseudouridine synthase D [Nitzschia inconspicua]
MNGEDDTTAALDASAASSNHESSIDPHEDEMEQSVGISEYLSDTGFSAVSKARYSDFLVHEVDLQGNVARLTSMAVPTEDNNTNETTAPSPAEDDKKLDMVVEEGGEEIDLETQLTRMIKEQHTAKKVLSMLEIHDDVTEGESTDKTAEKFVTLPALEKGDRKAVHEWVRKALPNARADTLNGHIRIWHVKFEKEMPNYGNFGPNNNNNSINNNRKPKRQKPNWPSDRPDYLRFVLYKENMDTTTATKELSRKGSRGARIGYAGMKDKRGITTQFCTLYRTVPSQLVNPKAVASSKGGGNTKDRGFSVVRLGNFEYTSKELKLGMLKGNRFDIILRNVQAPGDDLASQRHVLEQAAQSMKDKGFINYFGTQRFGKFKDTHLVGIAAVQGNFEEAVDILMRPKSDEREDIKQVRVEWQERFKYGKNKENEANAAKSTSRKLNRFMTGEVAILQSLAKYPMDYTRAFSTIPFNLRTMFVHAVQSLIWNRAVSYRIGKMSKDSVLVGDLVDVGKGSETVHVVTEVDIANKKFTLEDVVVPMVGKKSVYPTNELGEFILQLLEEVGLKKEMFQDNKCRSLIVTGDYRKIICHPTDVDYKIQEYFDPLQPLLQTDLMKLQDENIVIRSQQEGERAKLAMVVGFTLPSSSYATIALRELMRRPTSNEFQKDLTLE